MSLDLPAIAGNHEGRRLGPEPEKMSRSDRYRARSRSMTGSLSGSPPSPPTLQLADDIYVCHGTPDSDLDDLLETVTPEGRRA